MHQQNFEIINEARIALKDMYGHRLAKIILYGSYARGDQHAESDIDLLVVLNDQEVTSWKEIRYMNESLFPLSLQHNISLSAHPMSVSRFENGVSFFLDRVRKEGKEL